MVPMKVKKGFVPDTWKMGDKKAIGDWMDKLPIVKDLNAAREADDNYQKELHKHYKR